MKSLISIIVPVYNEQNSLSELHRRVSEVMFGLAGHYDYELIIVDDGSTDGSDRVIEEIVRKDSHIKPIIFSRNFGKESATSAGFASANGSVAIMMDADLQHPPELIPEFLRRWEQGIEVVVGVRKTNHGTSIVKRVGAWVFYKIMAMISEIDLTPNATDYRLLDRQVIDEFNRLTEKNRITRGLIDWLGFRRDYIYFDAPPRAGNIAGYNFIKLARLAFNSMVSLSLLPLRLAGYLGIFIMFFSGIFGFVILTGKYFLESSFALSFSGSAQLAILIVFLVGIILSCLGLIALYIANIHREVINRPMYIIRRNAR